jgi:1-deoxy-D-xylulose-5-phosphate reductoisomerase
MKVPIQYALSYPQRWSAPHARIDWSRLSSLDFEPVDGRRFPCLPLAYEALRKGGCGPAILNAANEEAVALFLQDLIAFTEIPRLIEVALASVAGPPSPTIEDLVEVDRLARIRVKEHKYATTH